jgi:hypothetical protein
MSNYESYHDVYQMYDNVISYLKVGNDNNQFILELRNI